MQHILADEPGLQFFAFQGNINNAIKLNEIGRISNEVYRKDNGKWTIQNQNINLVKGNVIHYWISVQVKKIIYNKTGTWKGMNVFYLYCTFILFALLFL